MITNIWHTVYPILIAILFFELIIIIHEGGHFIAARLMGIKVNEFSIGMGPKLIQFQRGETKYSLRLILFGGYCAMEGESEESEDERSFAKKKVLQRIFVVSAGALMNLILGFVIAAILVSSQELVGTATVARFEKTAVSNAALQVGDTIKTIDGMRVYSATDVSTGFSRSKDDTLEMTVLRNGEEKKLSVKFNMEESEGHRFIHMDFWLLGEEKTVANVLKTSALDWMSYARTVFLSVHDMITGRYGFSDMSGPVGAVNIVSKAVKSNSFAALRIMALLTINVGLFNLFPIPALDGWRLFLLIFEGIFRKKIPDKWEWAINAAGLAVLLAFMSVITFSDISKLFK
ncbi:MAG: M50 family metallopeptidase [Eubacterium sp.]|nr:M50 family metallopeptidase [Eubacterium sp.]